VLWPRAQHMWEPNGIVTGSEMTREFSLSGYPDLTVAQRRRVQDAILLYYLHLHSHRVILILIPLQLCSGSLSSLNSLAFPNSQSARTASEPDRRSTLVNTQSASSPASASLLRQLQSTTSNVPRERNSICLVNNGSGDIVQDGATVSNDL
jgi:hypothetical protein